MLVRSIRLLNIKSFGEGADGTGVHVYLDRGINHIAGRNGAGKSTLIEALGYVLFDCPPAMGVRMDIETALVRQGYKQGEIEAEVETAEGVYRVKRGVGKRSKVRWTVADEGGFVTHETEDEVRRFLAAAAGLPAADGLSDLFRKLLGVRQGRLIDPFEATPTEARRHFAPILDVEVYQRCFNELSSPVQTLKEDIKETAGNLKAARTKIDIHGDAPQEVERLKRNLEAAEPELQRRKQAMAKAREGLAEAEAKGKALTEAATALEAARNQVKNADTTLATRRELLARAEQAHGVLEATAQAHAAYEKAEKQLATIAGQRKAYEEHRTRVNALKEQHARAETRSQQADQRVQELLTDIEQRKAEVASREAALEERRKALAEGDKAEPEVEPDEKLKEALTAVHRWAAQLTAASAGARAGGQAAEEAANGLSQFDPDRINQAKLAREAAREQYEQAKERFTEIDARRQSRREMAQDLGQTRRCPLLAEHCRQYDPGKLVLSEVQLDEVIEEVRNELAVAEATLRGAEQGAVAAEKEIEDSQKIRARADVALTEVQRHLKLTTDSVGRKAHQQLAEAYDPGQPRTLPGVPNLPDPGEDPWTALGSAPTVAEAFFRFSERVTADVTEWQTLVTEREQRREDRRRQHELKAQDLKLAAEAIREQRGEFNKRRDEYEEQKGVAREAAGAVEKLTLSLKELREKAIDIDGLEEKAEKAEKTRAATDEAHRKHIAAEADAGRLEKTRADVAVAIGDLERARKLAVKTNQMRDAAQAAYDPDAHTRAQAHLLEATREMVALEKDLDRDREDLKQAEQRAKALEAAKKEAAESRARGEILEARRALLEHARRTLREVGPRVAEQLIQAVNMRAQAIYTALSPHDPGQLEWQPDYELRVATSTGIRRFATLSGGQKVKAALATQLALVQQFSNAGICIFDEPTYALDGESRTLLAEAIGQAQEVTAFDQLFIVSHDDAFDGHVEHTVYLTYSPVTGTTVE